MTRKVLSYVRAAVSVASGLIAASVSSSCGSSARPRHGPLAGAADTVAAAFRVACNGPDACFGYRGAELGFFETMPTGVVKFVAQRSGMMTGRAADSVARHLRDSVARHYGSGIPCPPTISDLEERQWLHDGRQVVIVVEKGLGGDSGVVTIVQRGAPRRCGVRGEEPELFM